MAENLDVLNTAVSQLIRAVLLAARFSGRVRRPEKPRRDAKTVPDNVERHVFAKRGSPPTVSRVPRSPSCVTSGFWKQVLSTPAPDAGRWPLRSTGPTRADP